MENEQTISLASTASALYDGLLWFFQNLLLSFYNIGYAVSNPGMWLDWSEKKSIMRFVYYGGSVEFFFAVLLIFLALFIVGVFRPAFMWGNIRLLEGFANTVGRFFAWAGLIMVLQQVLIIIMQRIFTRPDIVIGFGIPLSYDISWYAEELKLYNALVVSLCATYTFVQGGHVRVDLFYAGAKFRTKKIVDMFGSMVFMLPMAVLIWMYGWYFLWRHLIVPKPSASDALDRLLAKSRVLKWNVETIGFSPNGFTGYFLFKILLVAFAGMIFIHAWAFFMRSFQELREGQSSENKYRDVDQLPDLTEVVETNN
jgi:TRAP-type mannitol/chloroaromatic compound transport system permease small subunit